MSDFKDSRFFKFISSLLGQAPEDKWKYSESEEERFTAADSDASTNLPERLWKKDNEPLRQIVLWGWDENNNPGFLILYGTQHFKSKGAAGNLLQNEVKY
ncbi:MAG: hypothetical protein Q8930_13030, partial [Bacillota bacterium]|nr:hypothetical protein [Bacillota bacterium]